MRQMCKTKLSIQVLHVLYGSDSEEKDYADAVRTVGTSDKDVSR